MRIEPLHTARRRYLSCVLFTFLVLFTGLFAAPAAQAQLTEPLYFSDCSENPASVWEYDASTGNTFALYTRPGGNIHGFAFAPWDRDLLYYVDANGTEIYSADVNGGSGEQMIYSHWTYVRDVAFDGNNQLYFSEASGGGGDGYIYRLESNGSASLVFTVQLSQINGFWSGNFAFAPDGSLWLTSGNTSGGGYYEADQSTGALTLRFDGATVGLPQLVLGGFSFGPDGQPYIADDVSSVRALRPQYTEFNTAFYDSAWGQVCNTGFRSALPSTPQASGSWVLAEKLGSIYLDRIQSSGLVDYTDSLSGLTMTGAPFGGMLAFRVRADSAVPTPDVYYYRLRYRQHASPAGGPGPWTDFSVPVSAQYVRSTFGQFPVFSSLKLGPFEINGQQLYRFRPHAWELPYLVPAGSGTVDWTNDPEDYFQGWLDTTGLPAGAYDIRLEVLDENGSLNPGASFQMLLPDGPVVSGSFATQAAPMTNGGHEFIVHIDNRPATAEIYAPQIGATAADACGFLRYNLTSPGDVELAWQAWQPGTFAVYSFNLLRASSGIGWLPLPGGGGVSLPILDEVTSTAHNGVGGEFYELSTSLGLLGGCTEAAFAASLHVYAKATTGNGQRIFGYDASDLRAFAIAPQ